MIKSKIQFKTQSYLRDFRLSAVILGFLVLSFALPAFSAELYLEPAAGEYRPGQTFIVKVKIDTREECINAVSVNLSYDKDILNAADFSQGESIISLWLEPPEINEEEGMISFSGGIPGGYCGRITGDPGQGDILGKIIFSIPGMIVAEEKEDIAEIRFSEDCQVLLNDGWGTEAELSLKNAQFQILDEPISESSPWKEEILMDKIPPESFEILILSDPKAFEGKYFVIFQAQDKQTGIDHFAVKEGEGDWKIALSPYLLEDQDLESIIKVKAVDKAGNERIAEYIPEVSGRLFPCWLIFLILGLFGIEVFLIHRYLRKK